jgi:hypothetical protein
MLVTSTMSPPMNSAILPQTLVVAVTAIGPVGLASSPADVQPATKKVDAEIAKTFLNMLKSCH